MACCPCTVACCVQIPCFGRLVRWCYNDSKNSRDLEAAMDDGHMGSMNQVTGTNVTAGGQSSLSSNATSIGLVGAQTRSANTPGRPANRPHYSHPQNGVAKMLQQEQNSSSSNDDVIDHELLLRLVPHHASTPKAGPVAGPPMELGVPLRRSRSVTFAHVSKHHASATSTPVQSPCTPVRGIRKTRSSYGPAAVEDDML